MNVFGWGLLFDRYSSWLWSWSGADARLESLYRVVWILGSSTVSKRFVFSMARIRAEVGVTVQLSSQWRGSRESEKQAGSIGAWMLPGPGRTPNIFSPFAGAPIFRFYISKFFEESLGRDRFQICSVRFRSSSKLEESDFKLLSTVFIETETFR